MEYSRIVRGAVSSRQGRLLDPPRPGVKGWSDSQVGGVLIAGIHSEGSIGREGLLRPHDVILSLVGPNKRSEAGAGAIGSVSGPSHGYAHDHAVSVTMEDAVGLDTSEANRLPSTDTQQLDLDLAP